MKIHLPSICKIAGSEAGWWKGDDNLRNLGVGLRADTEGIEKKYKGRWGGNVREEAESKTVSLEEWQWRKETGVGRSEETIPEITAEPWVDSVTGEECSLSLSSLTSQGSVFVAQSDHLLPQFPRSLPAASLQPAGLAWSLLSCPAAFKSGNKGLQAKTDGF